MKKASGFEKFFKGKEKTGAAKKEALRQEKRQTRKQREDEIAEHKRQQRAKRNAGSVPPKYNLEPPASRFQKRESGSKPSFAVNKKKEGSPSRDEKQDRASYNKQKDRSRGFGTKPNDRERPPFKKPEDSNRFEKKGKDFSPEGKNKSFDKKNKPFERSNKRFGGKEKPYEKFERKAAPAKHRDDKPRESFNVVKKAAAKTKVGAGLKPKTSSASVNNSSPVQTDGDQMPLNKFIAHSGVCSRRDAVELIKGGKVKVNGSLVLEPGHKVALTDDVSVSGKHLKPVKDFVYILLNKPKDYLTTTEDPQERKTVLDLLHGAPDTRIYPVGRLDRNTSGVLLLTNDGDLSQKLTHPSNEVKKVYAVTLDKPLTKHHFDEILRGVELEDGPAHVDVLAYADAKDHTQIGVELHSGRNRIVRRIFEHFGYDVKALDRVMFAGLTKKNVNRGKWRFLTEREVRDLKFFRKGR